MNYQNNQQGLPFNPRQPMSNFLNISLNNPPHVPVFNCPQYIQSYVPFIAAATALEIQNRAQSNPLRMFMFNQYSVNNYANADFEALVVGIVEYIGMMSKRNVYPNIDTAIQDSVPKMVEMLCSVNMRQFPALEREIDSQTVNSVRNTIGHFDQICNEIKQGQYQQPPQQNWSQGGGNNMNYQQPQQGQQSGYVNAPMSSYNNRGQQPQQGQQGQQTSLFGSSQPSPMPQKTGQTMGGKYSNDTVNPLSQPFTPRTPANQPQQAAQQEVQQPKATDEVLATDSKWIPSQRYPYYPAYNPMLYTLYFKTEADGSIKPVLKEKSDMMEYDRHSISTVFGPVPKKLDLSKSAGIMLQIEEGIKIINADSTSIKDRRSMDTTDNADLDDLVTTHVNQKTFVQTSVNEAWFTGSVERLLANNGKMPSVYRIYARVTDPIITMNDESAVVTNFGNSKTFIELREKLDSATDEISAELWGASNMRMTQLVNKTLRLNMSLPDLYIESFVTDIQDLINLLEENYGAAIQTAFLKYQKASINATFQTLLEENANELTAMFLGDKVFEENAEPKITYITSDISLTYLNCLSHELELDMAPNIGSAITQALTPMMFNLVEGLFKDIAARGNNFAQHLIRTNDGRIIEVAKGNIGDDFYTAILVN